MTELGIVAFLTRCLDEDEVGALAAAEEFGPDWIEIWSGTVDLSANREDRQPQDSSFETHVPTNDSRVSRFMVEHDPARVLADIAAKRVLLQLHAPEDGVPEHRCKDLDPELGIRFAYVAVCLTLRLLAAPYAHRPGYNPAWTVEEG